MTLIKIASGPHIHAYMYWVDVCTLLTHTAYYYQLKLITVDDSILLSTEDDYYQL